MSKRYFISTNFAMKFLLSSALPPLASNFELTEILKSAVKTIRLF